ncbi:MAG TPA: type VI secretion system tip protein TssI/VgrG [Lacunisphaera sp.]|jgi:type VI secretion system secreted protein VgrG
MPTYTQANRSVRIETPFGADVLLLKTFRGTECLGKPFQYELILASEEPELDYEKIIGQKVTITVETGGHSADGSTVTRYFHGFVSRFSQTNYEGKLAEYRATVVPWLWFLTRSANCRIFQNLKIPDILTQVFKDFGFSDIISQLHGNYRTWNYCVQYRETAFQFVSRLMEEEGIYYYFTHENGKHSLVLCDSAASHQEFPGYAELLYRPASDGVQETLRSWAVQHEVQSDAYATTNFNFTAPNAYSVASSFENRGFGQTKLEQFDYLGEQSEFNQYSAGAPNENDRYSQMRLQELQARFETYSGESDARGIATGAKFVLKGHPRKAFEKAYLTTGTDYLIESNPFETAADQGKEFNYQVKLTAILLATPFRTPRVTPKPIVHGPQTATVVGPDGEKISTDQYGQVKVQFHWDRLGKNDQNSSCYMRVSQAWAGKNWGDMAIPHVGDEVIVECLEGDPDRPIITGRVYNNANMPPMALPANKHKRVWADDYGNELVFDATPGDEHILLRSPHHTSGITLGRSATNFTESNTNAVNLGDSFGMTVGATAAVTAGGAVGAVIGSNVAGVLGLNAAINVGPQVGINLGPQFTVTSGIKYDRSTDDDFKIVQKNYVLSAGGVLNLVGGSGPEKGSAVIYGDDDGLQLSVGDAVTVTPPSAGPTVLGLNIASAVLFVAVTGLMAGTAGFVDSYNPDASEGSDPNKSDMQNAADTAKQVDDYSKLSQADKDAYDKDANDRHAKRQQDSLNKQTGFEVAAGVTMVAALGCLLASYVIARDEASETALSRHVTGKYTARVLLDHVKKRAILEGCEETRIVTGADGDTGSVNLNGDEVKAEHKAKVTLQVATNSISIKSSEIAVSGTNVKITGANIDLGGGAVTILGVAQPAVPKLAVDSGKLKADETIKATKYLSVVAQLKAKLVTMGGPTV